MTNRFYNSNFVAVPTTTIRSQSHIQQYQAVQAGFDAVQTELDAKPNAAAMLTSGSWTHSGGGTIDLSAADSVLLPSVGLAEATMNKAATLQYVKDVLGASGSLIPPTTGNAGKALMTLDGVTYGWQFVLPSQTGKAGKMLRSTGAVGAEEWVDVFAIGYGGMQVVTATTTLNGTKRTIDVSVSTPGLTVALPDATTLRVGDSFLFHATGGAAADTQGIVNGAGSLIYSLSSALSPVLYLYDNSSPAGVWKVWDTAVGTVASMPSSAQISGALTTLRASRDSSSVAQIDSTNYLVACGSTGAGNGVDILIATVNTTDLSISAGAVTTVGTDRVVWSKLLPVTGGWIFLYQDASNALRGVGITVTGSTIAASAPVTILSGGPAIFKNNVDAASVGATAVVTFPNGANTSISAVALQLSGTTIIQGGTQVLASAASLTSSTRVLAVSVTSFLWVGYTYDGANYTLRSGALTLSGGGVTITPGTVTTSASFGGGSYLCLDVALIDATTLFVAYQANNSGASARVISAVTTTPVFGAAQAMTNGGMVGPIRHVDAVKAGSYYVVSFCDGSSGRTSTCTVSGTTVTEAAASGGSILGYNNSVASISSPTANMVYDGTYVIACYSNTGAFAFYTFSGAGYTQVLGFTAVAYPYTGPSIDKQQIWRVAANKVVIAFGEASGIQARAYRYGGIA